jgi:hypothetical protein
MKFGPNNISVPNGKPLPLLQILKRCVVAASREAGLGLQRRERGERPENAEKGRIRSFFWFNPRANQRLVSRDDATTRRKSLVLL